MIFKELLEQSNWDNIEKALHYYDDKEEKHIINTDNFKKAYKELLELIPIENTESFKICLRKNEFYDIYGIYPKDHQHYALEYNDWKEWLGYEIEEYTLTVFDIDTITTHCLWEITWNGFSYKQCKKAIKKFEKAMKSSEIKFKRNSKVKRKTMLNNLEDRLKIEEYLLSLINSKEYLSSLEWESNRCGMFSQSYTAHLKDLKEIRIQIQAITQLNKANFTAQFITNNNQSISCITITKEQWFNIIDLIQNINRIQGQLLILNYLKNKEENNAV